MARLFAVFACAALVSWPQPIAADQTADTTSQASSTADQLADAEYVAVGKLERKRSTTRDGYDYIVRGERDGIRYFVIPSEEVRLSPLVGRRVAVAGKARYRPDQTAAFVRASKVAPVDSDVNLSQPVRLAQQVEELPPEGEEPPAPEDLPAPLEELLPPDWGDPVEQNVGGEVCGECQPSCVTCSPCSGRRPIRYWVRAEYLLWWTSGMYVPPLVTTSPPGTDRAAAGVLGQPGTTILFGNEEIFTDARSGGRIRVGLWLDPCGRLGLEGEWLGLDQETLHFQAGSDAAGNPILARPFFNVNAKDPTTGNPIPSREDSELVSFPGVLAGAVMVDAATSLSSAGVRKRMNLYCRDSSCCDPGGGGCRHCSRLDFLLGYRYLRLKERLMIREDLTSLNPNEPGEYDIFDLFDTRNEFHGGEIGVLWEIQRHRWTLELLGKLAVGAVTQDVGIQGGTIFTDAGGAVAFSGGLLAQRTNSGLHSRDQFAVLPELGVTLGWRLTQRLKAVLGYSFLYLSPVVRPGDQIDLDVNPDLLPPEAVPFTGPPRPQFVFRDTDYWAQGISVGLDYHW